MKPKYRSKNRNTVLPYGSVYTLVELNTSIVIGTVLAITDPPKIGEFYYSNNQKYKCVATQEQTVLVELVITDNGK